MSTLRSKVIRLAHSKPELRPVLLPLLKEAVDYKRQQAAEKTWKSKGKEFHTIAKRMVGGEAKVYPLSKTWGPSHGWQFSVISKTDKSRRMSADFRIAPHEGPFGTTTLMMRAGAQGRPDPRRTLRITHRHDEPFGDLTRQEWAKAEKWLEDTIQESVLGG